MSSKNITGSSSKIPKTPSNQHNRQPTATSSTSSKKLNYLKNPIKNNSTNDLPTTISLTENIFSPAVNKKSTPNIVKSKSITTLNACYTPSSLFRNNGTTPSKHKSLPATPKSTLKRLQQSAGCELSTPECYSKVSMDTQRSVHKNDDDLLMNNKATTSNNSEISNLTVAVRVRPMNAKECTTPSVQNIITVNNDEITVLAGTTADSSAGVSHTFQYDHAYWSCNSEHNNYADQEAVFNGTALPLLDNAFDGYNACLFAYGQTGSGKSYSMMGVDNDDLEIATKSEAGIIPRFCQEIFRKIATLKGKMRAELEISYFEIYNEKIHDLLAVSPANQQQQTKRAALRVREHPIWGPYVVDLSTHPVDSHTSLRNWLAVGNSQRATAATGMNDKSSRSHSIFNIVLNLSEIVTGSSNLDAEFKQTKRSKISLVDLAGSERISNTCASGERLREGVSINKSLLTLGKVISALADSRKPSAGFVPYRESVLTWLLRESLGGNSRTIMLATISPANIHLDETLATLRYACQARTIVNRVKVNEDPHDRQIRELRAEVERLQVLQQDYERQKRYSTNASLQPRKIIIETSVDESEVEALRQQLNETEQELAQAQRSWMDRLREAENIRVNEMRMLQRNGLALKISAAQMQACLVNLSADPMLSGTLLYLLPPKRTVKIGRTRPTAFEQPDIVLEGPLVAFNHCSIENRNSTLFIEPNNEEFETFVNGELLTDRQQIFHGDRVVIGGSHYFWVSNPDCPNKLENITIDYQLAHQEILKQQERRLREQLDAEKEIALRRIEDERAANERNYAEKMAHLEMEKFRYKCSKEMLETEKKAMQDGQAIEPKFEYHPPHQSKLLDEIKRIMQHPSDECLHQTQLMVKEATQRCRDIGVDLEFKQSQVADEFGIFKAVVNIIDKKNRLMAEWPPARLDVWLDIIRENPVDSENLFDCVDIQWQSIDNCDNEFESNDSLNSSRISLNLSAVKEIVLGHHTPEKTNFQKLRNMFSGNKTDMLKSAILNNSSPKSKDMTKNITKTVLSYENENDKEILPPKIKSIKDKNCLNDVAKDTMILDKNGFSSMAQVYLRDLRKTTLRLKKLSIQHSSGENIHDVDRTTANCVLNCVEQIEQINNEIKNLLIDKEMIDLTVRTPKSVRFLLD